MRLRSILVMSIVLAVARVADAGSAWERARTWVLQGATATRPGVGIPGRIDHMAVDVERGRLYVAALENGSVEVLDLAGKQRERSISGLREPQGVAVVPAAGVIAVACGGDGRLHMFDRDSLVERGSVEVGPDADNVRLDPRDGSVWVCYGGDDGGGVVAFDPRTWRKGRDLRFARKPESFQLEPGGTRMFVNLPGGVRATADGEIAVVDRVSGKRLADVRLSGLARNFPMTFDGARQRLFVACRHPATLVVVDTRRCQVVGRASCIDDADDVFLDSERGRVIVIGGGFRRDLLPGPSRDETGAIDVFTIGASPKLLSRTATAPHARTGLWVASRRALYVAVPPHQGQAPEVREYRASSRN